MLVTVELNLDEIVEDANESRLTIPEPQPGSTVDPNPEANFLPERGGANESILQPQTVVDLDEFPSCISQSDISYHQEQHIGQKNDLQLLQEAPQELFPQVPTVATNTGAKQEKQPPADLMDNWADLLGDSKPTSARYIVETEGILQGLSPVAPKQAEEQPKEAERSEEGEQKQNKSLLGAFFVEDFANQFPVDEFASANHSVDKGLQLGEATPKPVLFDLQLDHGTEPALFQQFDGSPAFNLLQPEAKEEVQIPNQELETKGGNQGDQLEEEKKLSEIVENQFF